MKNLRMKKSENENLRIKKSENGKSETNHNLVHLSLFVISIDDNVHVDFYNFDL